MNETFLDAFARYVSRISTVVSCAIGLVFFLVGVGVMLLLLRRIGG